MLASGGAHKGTLAAGSQGVSQVLEPSEYSQGRFEYHTGTGALTWALLVLTDGTLSTHTDTVNDRIRYSEYFHAVLRVPAWGTLDARMNDAE
jgi:hypothetical protein